MWFTKEYKEILSGGQEITVKITATIEGKITDIKELLHIVAEIPRRFSPIFYLELGISNSFIFLIKYPCNKLFTVIIKSAVFFNTIHFFI
ncbi:hypothetical protein C7439_11136 [Lachnoanaerobaculum umeaense]|nr:hypothetical protein C7439_11136 [Lachnoanaerobaculum umeaense]